MVIPLYVEFDDLFVPSGDARTRTRKNPQFSPIMQQVSTQILTVPIAN